MCRWRQVARTDKIANREAHFVRGVESLLIEIDDVKFHGDELQPILIRNDDTDGFPAELNNLLLHGRLPQWLLKDSSGE